MIILNIFWNFEHKANNHQIYGFWFDFQNVNRGIALYSDDINDDSLVPQVFSPIDFAFSEIFNHSLQGYSCFLTISGPHDIRI